MKVHNAVVGMEVQVKHDCRGHCREFIKEGLVCTVSRIDDGYLAEYELRLVNPDIDDGHAWVNASDVRKYIQPTESPFVVEPIPKALTLQDIQVGDWVVCNGADTYLTKGIAYEVVGVTAWGSLLVSNPSERNTKWATGYAVLPRSFNKVLREVNDATPRMAQSGSESTCRSE